jgi:hypothetical protein
MSQTAPIDGEIDASVLERTAQIIKMSSSQSSSGAIILAPISDPASIQGKQALSLKDGEYVGDVLNGVPHGRGTLTYHPAMDRTEYKGEWKEGEFHGRGVLTFTSGSKMTGTWVNGFLEGEGIYEWESGAKYQGTFKNSQFHGKGKCRNEDGSNYTGDFENGQEHGQGTYTKSDGDSYTGQWVKSIMSTKDHMPMGNIMDKAYGIQTLSLKKENLEMANSGTGRLSFTSAVGVASSM